MRRCRDSWLNATQILKVAGMDKGKRTAILEKEIQPGEHEKVYGGYGKYQGTWIRLERGVELCKQYGVEELLRPLLTYGIEQNTPTKEQVLAARRERLYAALELSADIVYDAFLNGTSASNMDGNIDKARFSVLPWATHNDIEPAPPTDSGYGSFLSRDKTAGLTTGYGTTHGAPLSSDELPTTSGSHSVNPSQTQAMEDDTSTLYSDSQSQAGDSKTQRYVSEFADHLFGKIRHLIDGNTATIGKIVICLPDLLKAFALKIGQDSPSRWYHEVTYFIHKHRG